MKGTNKAWIERQEQSDESRRFHEADRLAVWTMDSIADLMEKKGLSKADLARKLGCSRAHVTQLFSGARNPTLSTVADLAWALGFRASVGFEPLRAGEFISVPVCDAQILAFRTKRPALNRTNEDFTSEAAGSQFLATAAGC
ncbi:MAG: helix-turn-helix transcriptional regulator [Proteobacteria bacterium]|nr:helix-turn-helix transcriptional regulator [Pseudomonadota bacterium]